MASHGNAEQGPLSVVVALRRVSRRMHVDDVDLAAMVRPRAVLEATHLRVVGEVEDGHFAERAIHDKAVPRDRAVRVE